MTNTYTPLLDNKLGFEIPTYDGNTKSWTVTTFYTHAEFREFIESCFKKPGEYKFDEDYLIVNEQARIWQSKNFYSDAPNKSADFVKYWDDQKNKCQKGVIIHSRSGEVWYVTRDYYMWLNFLPIFHKEKRQNLFPDLYDGQYHTALYEYLGELKYRHAIILKKRQYAMSYFHMAKFINQIYFEKGITLKLVAYLDSYIGIEGSWAFLNEYRDFLNTHTAWFRPFDPDKVGSWQQRVKVTVNGRDKFRGRKGRLMGISTQQSPTKGVGGASRFIIAEESGVNPTLDKTYGYAKSALEAGLITIGQFIAYGSVGDLKQCEPLRKFMVRPEENGFFGVPTTDYDDKGTEKICGLFIPETWNMLPYSDKYGNSDIAGATAALLEKREQLKKDLSPEDYQLEISQHPLTIEEAFATREESPFPTHLLQKQLRRIEDKEYGEEYVDVYRDDKGKANFKPSKKLPINEFPLSKKASKEEKEGVVVMYERPDREIVPFSTYYASIDPLHTGKTKASRSLCSIIIYKNPIQVTKEKDDGSFETFYEGDKIVCEWTGRLDDIEDVHERCELILELYHAWCLIEFNGSFHTYMTGKKKSHYLVPSNQMIFNRELTANYSPNHPYGWKNTGKIFTTHILPYGIEYCTEVLDSEDLPNGNTIVKRWGVERLQAFRMLIKEMLQYHEGGNFDRLVAYCALIAFARIQQANRAPVKRTEMQKEMPVDKNMYKPKSQPFTHMGTKGATTMSRPPRSPYKNLR